jgi:hypothetical protein
LGNACHCRDRAPKAETLKARCHHLMKGVK